MACQHNAELKMRTTHKCKAHDYSHDYVRHSCGCEYCDRAWLYCPRCNATAWKENMLPGHPDYQGVK